MSLNQGDITKYKSLYLQTSWGYLNMLRKNVAFLHRDSQTGNAIEAAHLAAHSLKSQSILMGYTSTGQLSEKMEKIFKASKEKTLVLDKTILEAINISLFKIQGSLNQISENGTEVDMTEEIKILDGILVGSQLI